MLWYLLKLQGWHCFFPCLLVFFPLRCKWPAQQRWLNHRRRLSHIPYLVLRSPSRRRIRFHPYQFRWTRYVHLLLGSLLSAIALLRPPWYLETLGKVRFCEIFMSGRAIVMFQWKMWSCRTKGLSVSTLHIVSSFVRFGDLPIDSWIPIGGCTVQVILATSFSDIPHDKAYWSQIWGPVRNINRICVQQQGYGGIVIKNGLRSHPFTLSKTYIWQLAHRPRRQARDRRLRRKLNLCKDPHPPQFSRPSSEVDRAAGAPGAYGSYSSCTNACPGGCYS